MRAVVLGGERERGLLTKVVFRIESKGVVKVLDDVGSAIHVSSC
jgi:hypothetical protein